MAQHLIDTDIEVSQCPRCKSIGFKAQVSGFAVAADATPLNGMEDIREVLMTGRQVYRVAMQAGKPWRLKTLSVGDDFSGVLVGDHSCGIRAVSAHAVEVIPVDPQQAPVSPGRPVDGLHPQEQPASAVQGRSALPARSVIRRRSDIWRCDSCTRIILEDEEFVGLEVPGQPRWSRHVDCASPKMAAANILSRERDYTSFSMLARQGLSEKPMETVNLPEDADGT